MANLTNMELDTLRHFMGDLTLSVAKNQSYAQQCNDPQLRNFFNSAAQSSAHSLQTFKQFLN